MKNEEFQREYLLFKQSHAGVGNTSVLDATGKVIFATNPPLVPESDAPSCIKAWLEHQSAIEFNGLRFAILSWEELQFAARNTQGKGAVIGCKTKAGHYILVHLLPECKIAPSVASIELNRWSWNLV